MTEPTNTTAVKPGTIQRMNRAADAAHALLAGRRLAVFTHLVEGPRTPAELATSLGVAEERLARLLLCARRHRAADRARGPLRQFAGSRRVLSEGPAGLFR